MGKGQGVPLNLASLFIGMNVAARLLNPQGAGVLLCHLMDERRTYSSAMAIALRLVL